jgi:hypothetical protein
MFCAVCHGPTPNIISLVSANYVSRYEKSIFNNKKTPEPGLRSVRPRSGPTIVARIEEQRYAATAASVADLNSSKKPRWSLRWKLVNSS